MMYGTTSADFDKVIESRQTNHHNFTSAVDKKLKERLIEMFTDKFYGTQALYVMAHENNQTTQIDNSIETNTITIGIKKTKNIIYLAASCGM